MTPPHHSPEAAQPIDATLELAELFTHTARRLRRGSSAQVAPLGLTYAQARALRLVAQAGRPLRMAELAAQLEVVPRSATTMVDALESTGLVARHADRDDRRSVLVALTPGGRRLTDRLDRARRDSAFEVFGGLEQGQRQQLRALLEVLCQRGSCTSCCGDQHDGDERGRPRPGGKPTSHRRSARAADDAHGPGESATGARREGGLR